MLLSEAFGLYKENVILFTNQSRRTEEHLNCSMNSLLRFLGKDIDITELSFLHVRDWKNSMEVKGFSVGTIRGYLIRLRVVLGYLNKQGIHALHPDMIKLPKREEKIPHVIAKEDVVALLDANNKAVHRIYRARNRVIISLLYSSGIRVSELCKLDISDLRDGSFTIIGKGGKPRLCFYDDRTAKYLDFYLNIRKHGYTTKWRVRGKETDRIRYQFKGDNKPWLFVSGKTNKRMTPNEVQIMMKWCSDKAGFTTPVHPHTLRHTYATQKMMAGMHIYTLSRLLGHASIATTQTYLHIADPHLEEQYRKYHEI